MLSPIRTNKMGPEPLLRLNQIIPLGYLDYKIKITQNYCPLLRRESIEELRKKITLIYQRLKP